MSTLVSARPFSALILKLAAVFLRTKSREAKLGQRLLDVMIDDQEHAYDALKSGENCFEARIYPQFASNYKRLS